MTKLLEQALMVAQALPENLQDEIARLIMELADEDAALVMSPEEEASFAESLAQEERGEFASDEEVRALFRKTAL